VRTTLAPLTDISPEALAPAMEANTNAELPMMYAYMPGIYHVTTLPEARGQGFGTVMVLTAVRAAGPLGYRTGILADWGEGPDLYRRSGFEDSCQAEIYVGPE
jgi:GNAT superfamily N-acetyltransferase